MAAPGKGKNEAVALRDPDQMRQIAELAYQLWEKRGRPHGSDLQDWVEAEKIVLERTGTQRSRKAKG